MSSQVTTAAQSANYANKRRKRPEPRTKNQAPVKTNPSKRHRDRLNTELERLSDLIPLPQDVVNKLDKLSILRLSVAYLRNKSYSKHIDVGDNGSERNALLPVNRNHALPASDISESELALQALDGFIMVVTQDFNVFYITSTVQDCLGYPQSDVLSQSMLEFIHAEDRKLFMKQMLINPMGPGLENPPEDGDPPETPDYVRHGLTADVVRQLSQDGLLHRSFICRLRCLHDTSSGFLALHLTGHLGLVPGQNRHHKDGALLPPELGLFLLASPLQTPSILEIRTKNYIFRTKHKLDYTPLGIDQKGRIVLGYTEQELRQQSGYQFIHSADMMHCADAHTKLMRKGQSGMTVFRLLHRANRWQWVTASARLIFNKGVPDYIISTHRPITEQEGDEHLKKRNVAFRFDFTGHASLYASVNPIGAGPPPPNSSHGGSADSITNMSGPKRSRIVEQEIDPATLFGAQSFQSMSNYPEGLPMVKAALEPAPAVLYNDSLGLVKDEGPYGPDMGGYFKQSPSGSSPAQSFENGHKITSPRSDNADSGFSDNDFQNSPTQFDILQSLVEEELSLAEPYPPTTEFDKGQLMSGYQNQNHVPHPQQQLSLAEPYQSATEFGKGQHISGYQSQNHVSHPQQQLTLAGTYQPATEFGKSQHISGYQAQNHVSHPQQKLSVAETYQPANEFDKGQHISGYQSQNHVSHPQQPRQMPPHAHYNQTLQPQVGQAQNWAQMSQKPPMVPQMHPQPAQHERMMNSGMVQNNTNQYHQGTQGYSNQQGSASMNYQQQNQGYPSHNPPVRQMQYQQPSHQQPAHQQPPHHYTVQPAQYQQPLNQQPMHGNQSRMYQHQSQQLPQYQSQPQQSQGSLYPKENATKNFMDQIHPPQAPLANGYHDQRRTTAMPKDNVSILNAIAISSTISSGQSDTGQQKMQEMINFLGPENPNASTDQFEISLEYQESTIQFDMDRIAAEYQTTNPLGVIQNYVQNNPKDALALATGTMPDAELRNVMPSNVIFTQQDQYLSNQYNQAPIAQKTMNQGYPQAQGGRHNQHQPSQQHAPNQLAGVKRERPKDELADLDLDDLLTFDVPNI